MHFGLSIYHRGRLGLWACRLSQLRARARHMTRNDSIYTMGHLILVSSPFIGSQDVSSVQPSGSKFLSSIMIGTTTVCRM